jgi:Na+(H+)/acetate symporter ActP
MNYLDWIVIVIYLLGVILLALYFNRRQNDTEDYYLGGRKIKWWSPGPDIGDGHYHTGIASETLCQYLSVSGGSV